MIRLQRTTQALLGAVLLSGLAACGVTKAYVGANARTIRTSAEMTKKTLAVCIERGNCAALVGHMNADLDQISERANAMCAIVEPECEGAPK